MSDWFLTAKEHAAIWRHIEREVYRAASAYYKMVIGRAGEETKGLHQKADVLMLQAEFARTVSGIYSHAYKPEALQPAPEPPPKEGEVHSSLAPGDTVLCDGEKPWKLLMIAGDIGLLGRTDERGIIKTHTAPTRLLTVVDRTAPHAP